MSYANGTQFYNLPQTVGTDKRDWFDANAAFAAVDAALHAAATGQAADAEAIAAINTSLASDEANIASLQTASTTHSSEISALQATVATQGTAISDVRQDAEDMISAFNEGAASVSTHAYAIGDYFIYNDVLYKATAAIAIGDTIVPNTNCSATNVTSEIKVINADIDEVKSDLADVTDGFTFTIQGSATYGSIMTAIKNNALYDTSKVKANTTIAIAGYNFHYTGVPQRFCATRFYNTNQVFVAQLDLDLDRAQHCAIGANGNTFTDLTNIAVDDNLTITVKY